MKREPVESSNIASIGYDAALQILEVQFRSGLIWQYSDVTLEEHRALMQAHSVGSHLSKHIRGQKEGGPIVEARPPASAFEDCAKAVAEYQDAFYAARYRQRLPKRATPPEVKDKDRFLSRPEPAPTPQIPVLGHPAPNSWYRVQLAVYPRACPACGRAVAAVWQDHHLAHPVQTGWIGGWVCQASLDGRDCSRFVFVHDCICGPDLPGDLSVDCPAHDGVDVWADGSSDWDGDRRTCEIIFNCQKTRALGVGEICAQVLAAKRAIAPKGIE